MSVVNIHNVKLPTFAAPAGWMRVVMLVVAIACAALSASAGESVRKERRMITLGNDLYRSQKYAEAKLKYRAALEENPASAVARFNIGLCDVRLAGVNKDNDSISKQLMAEGVRALSEVAALGREKPELSSKANYNLGNIRFENSDYAGAISMYKQALRLDPSFEDARRNLPIAQLKQQNQYE